MSLVEDLGLDSLQLLELVILCERVTGAGMPERLMPELMTLDDAFQWCRSQM